MNRVRNPFNALFNEVSSVQEEVSRLFGRANPFTHAAPAGPPDRRPPDRPRRRRTVLGSFF
ncbi:MAG: hypothetical protein J0H57_11090 [Rhodospirillales bacterium]|nr:hypothetical protein [Rhodospirillales bacterium]